MKKVVIVITMLFVMFNTEAQYNVGNGGGFGVSCLTTPVPLPIELLTFKGECKRDYVALEWTTLSELNNDYFTIERSSDAINFEVVTKIFGVGTSQQAINYTYEDKKIVQAVVYYRLKQTDYDGTSTYSGVIAVDCDNLGKYLVYPNPAKDIVYITADDSNETTDVQLFDSKGSVIFTSQFKINFSINTSSLSEGMYFLFLSNTKSTEIIKFLKTH